MLWMQQVQLLGCRRSDAHCRWMCMGCKPLQGAQSSKLSTERIRPPRNPIRDGVLHVKHSGRGPQGRILLTPGSPLLTPPHPQQHSLCSAPGAAQSPQAAPAARSSPDLGSDFACSHRSPAPQPMGPSPERY